MRTQTLERSALIRTREAARILGVSTDTLRRIVLAGSLEQVRIAGLGAPR
jgi:excisionase family DNA binding protein